MDSSDFSFLLLCILTVGEIEVAAEFRRDYSYEKDTDTYYKAHLPKSWFEAVQICASEGAVLASPSNYLESRIMEQVFASFGLTAPVFWVGISSLYADESDGEYRSVDGTPMSEILQIWRKEYPSNMTLHRCVSLRTRSLELENVVCNETHGFVCQHRNTLVNERQLDLVNVTSTYAGYTSVTGAMDSMIKVHNTPADYLTAMQTCAREGAKLAAPLNTVELGIYKLLLNSNSWIGICNKKFDPISRDFRYVDENLGPNPFLSWTPNNPSASPPQWFVALSSSGHHFNEKGNETYSFICAKDKMITFHNNPLNFPKFNSSAFSRKSNCQCLQ